MIELCPSCREPLDYPSGDGCAAMTLHKPVKGMVMSAAFWDDQRDMWVNCKTCSHVWVALRLPMEMRKAAKIMIKLCCPNCGADAKQIRVGKGKTDV